MILLLAAQVVGRYVFGFSPVWIIELSQYAFVWLSFLGVAVATRRRAHISLQYLWDKAPAQVSKAIGWLVLASMVAIGCFMIYGGSVLIQMFGETTSAGGIAMTWVYVPLVVSGAIICAFAIEEGLIDHPIPPIGESKTTVGDVAKVDLHNV